MEESEILDSVLPELEVLIVDKVVKITGKNDLTEADEEVKGNELGIFIPNC